MASMTRAELRVELIKQARIGANVSTTTLDTWLYEAIKQAQRDTRWLDKTRYLYVREYFSNATNEGFGIRLSAATGTNNIIRVATAQVDISGASFAEMLSTSLVAKATGSQITFSTGTFKFSIDISSNASTGFILGPPDYDSTCVYSNTFKLFGLESYTSVSGTTYNGTVCPWCTSEYPLPTDFLYVKEVRYGNNKHPLIPIIYKGRDFVTGTPQYYYIKGSGERSVNKLGLVPQPTTGGEVIKLDYYHIPPDFPADGTVHPFDEIFNYALIYYAAFLYKTHQEDNTNMLKFLNLYKQEIVKLSQLKGARIGGAIDMMRRGRGNDPRTYRG